MPLTRIQAEILRLLASHRDRDTTRYSGDIDIFHDREERVARAAEQDGAWLQEHGYVLQWLRREPAIYRLGGARQRDNQA